MWTKPKIRLRPEILEESRSCCHRRLSGSLAGSARDDWLPSVNTNKNLLVLRNSLSFYLFVFNAVFNLIFPCGH
jgi:hypothetical protein